MRELFSGGQKLVFRAVQSGTPISSEETIAAFQRLGKNKAPGGDLLRDDLLRRHSTDPEVINKITSALNKWYATASIPSYATRATIVSLAKQNTQYPEYGAVRPIASVTIIGLGGGACLRSHGRR